MLLATLEPSDQNVKYDEDRYVCWLGGTDGKSPDIHQPH